MYIEERSRGSIVKHCHGHGMGYIFCIKLNIFFFFTYIFGVWCVWKSLFIVYLNLSSRISTFNKNYKYLKELIKIAYDPYKSFLAYFNKLHGEAY